jgi:PAS domain-containing protein
VTADSDLVAKVAAERALYVGIVTSLVVVLAALLTWLRSFRMSTALDRLVEMNRLSGYSPDRALKRLGDIGPKIADLYAQLSDLSDKKSRKIASLTSLNDYLLSVMSQLVVVTDATGRVVQASKPVLERVSKSRSEVIGVPIDDLIPNADAVTAIREMDRSHVPVVRERRGDSLVFTPVIDRDNRVAYMVVVLTRNVTDEIRKGPRTSAGEARTPARTPTRKGFLSRLFRRRAAASRPPE